MKYRWVGPWRRASFDSCTKPTSGAHAVKLEGVDGHEEIIRHIVGSGVPVMGHIGLTPQSVNQLGGHRVQGRTDVDAATLIRQAHALEELGCFSIVLECMPADLAAAITSELQLPTIGMGAGAGTGGQVLVLQDLWGVDPRPSPRFVRRYLDGACVLTNALNRYDADVKEAPVSRTRGKLLVMTASSRPPGGAASALPSSALG